MSWMEVESKVKVGNVNDMRAKIKKIARFVKKSEKEDFYYTLKEEKNYPHERFRVRKTDGKYTLNFKKRKKLEHINVKEEFEISMKNFNVFTEFFEEMGFKQFIHKVKESEIYKYENAHIELNNVRHLGWFIEIEILCEKNKKAIKKAKEKVRKILKMLNVNKSKIEKRGYTIMLWEIGKLK